MHKNKFRAPLKPFDLPTAALSVGGLGFLRPAPGTWGSAAPVAIVGLLVLAGSGQGALYLATAVMLALSSLACVAWGGYAEERFGLKDAPEVVADESAGVCLPLLAGFPVATTIPEWLAVLAAAFLLFRLFDIIKPWPARQLEVLPAGWGVLLDDLMAGVYAALAMAALGWTWFRFFV